MPEAVMREAPPASLADHQAVQAWRQLRLPQAEPERIELLSRKHKSAVYRLRGAGSDCETVVAKRCRAATAGLERLIYEDLLPSVGVAALRCIGWVPESAGEFCWLFLEDAGTDAYSPTSAEHRALAGRFLAALHRLEPSQALRAALPDRSPAHYLRLIHFSREALGAHVDNPVLRAHEAELLRAFVTWCELMQTRWGELQEFFEAWPNAVVHDDFVIKNLRIRSNTTGPELLVFDWEMAGWGVPAVDLAQSLGKTASPDLETYGAARRGYDPQVTPGRLQRLAAYGKLLRLVDQVYWEAVTAGGPTYDYLARPIALLLRYESDLAAALRAVGWTTHDSRPGPYA
jgi:hypothetical protein